MKCDARAFARCPYKKQCSDSPEHTSFYEGTECDYFNQQVIHAPLTNVDRIRSMSDWELAVFLCAVKFRRETILNVPDFLYIKDAHDWLQQLYEGE